MKNWFFIGVLLVGCQLFSQGLDVSLVSGFIQTGSVKGKVFDANDGDGHLVFATVVVKELELQMETDIEGAFNFQLSPGRYTLEVNFIGYQEQLFLVEVVGGDTSRKTVFLEPLKIQSAPLLEPIDSFQF